MATFFVLPPRVVLEEKLGALLNQLLPGLQLPVDSWDLLVERFAEAAGWPEDSFMVPRDDIPFGEPVADALAEYFGAEPGDRVVEVSAHGTRTWLMPGVSAMVAAR